MATASITEDFIIEDKAVYERFLKLQDEPVVEVARPYSNRLEEGIEKLKQFSFR